MASYTTLTEVFIDTSLYFIHKKGGEISLGLLPSVAIRRWPWLVENYTEYRQRFEVISNGDFDLMKSLEDLDKFVDGYKLGNTKINPFDTQGNFVNFKSFLELITFGEINPTVPEVTLRNNEMERISRLEEDDFRSMLSLLRKTTAIFAQDLGLGDDTANEILGLTARKKKKTPTVTDMIKISNLNKVHKFIEGFIFDKQQTQKRKPNIIRITQSNLTDDSGFRPYDIYQSYYPVPFEISLESMAKKYLGSVQKWYELVTINDLKPPFVDVQGIKYDLLAPAAQNNLIISSASKDEIGPGVKINIGSFKHKEESRVIEKVTFNDDDTMVLFLSGNPDLNKFSPKENAFVRIFQAGTVRPNSMILIPTTKSATAPSAPTPNSDEIRRLDRAFIEFGVDIAKDVKTSDFIIDANGNFKLAYGYNAIRQAVLNVIKTEKGELTYHPKYGVNMSIGRSYLGSLDDAAKIGDLIRSTILMDSRFEDAAITRISTTNIGASLQIGVKIKGFDQVIPLSFVG